VWQQIRVHDGLCSSSGEAEAALRLVRSAPQQLHAPVNSFLATATKP
jgi:hypothetical protein